jgi:hypothetical protein
MANELSDEVTFIRYFNGALACVHYASAIGIGVYGYNELRDKSTAYFAAPIHRWYSLMNVSSCGPADFMIDSGSSPDILNRNNRFEVDSLLCCVLFGVISGTYHVFMFLGSFERCRPFVGGANSKSIVESMVNPYRWVDYGLSTPLMHLVLFANYGIVSQHAALCGALGMSLLQVIGFSIELNLDLAVKTNKFRYGVFALLTLGFFGVCLLFLPLFLNISYLILDDESAEKPPDAVHAFTFVLLALYWWFGFIMVYQVYCVYRYVPKVIEITNEIKEPLPLATINNIIRAHFDNTTNRLKTPSDLDLLNRLFNLEYKKSEMETFCERLLEKLDLLFERQKCYFYKVDVLYGCASASAKTILHWGLAFVVLQQGTMVTDTNNALPELVCTGEDNPPLDSVLVLSLIVLVSVGAAIFILCFLPLPLLNSPTVFSHCYRTK